MNYFKLQNSTFKQNVALASGGALFFTEQHGQIYIDNSTIFEKNSAEIGGGLRLLNSFVNLNPKELIQLMKKINFLNNFAFLFGQNFQLGFQTLQVEEIYMQKQGNQEKIEFVYNDFRQAQSSEYLGKLYIKNFKSGDIINMEVSIIDEEGNKFKIDQYCETCQYGTYFLQKYDNFNYTTYMNENQLPQLCKKCPKQANFCQGNMIQLEEGYWRESIQEDNPDLIQYCKNSPQNCREQYPNQIKGCVDGYIGPLCETCDSLGEVCLNKLHLNHSIYTKTGTQQLLSKSFKQHRYFLEPITLAPKLTRLSNKLFC
ncbi:transmembrane protein (macronuclear) [Tetrahymena thermophila SB210]|uniref:Transmembrane protein n=1 Tax=Tetrahymena thermophila (strain SB210) TaxID=312017 RepID=Q24F03_TETTS|nr:transmembrane protein [Tetrahymena thermophila SB210]EAS06352.2 transmembrane protein [Tetrahymena thermophila SB210]|eukprot:XP_001026597.2 transmembrane protein [Tetrahymena thermophila SB210]